MRARTCRWIGGEGSKGGGREGLLSPSRWEVLGLRRFQRIEWMGWGCVSGFSSNARDGV